MDDSTCVFQGIYKVVKCSYVPPLRRIKICRSVHSTQWQADKPDQPIQTVGNGSQASGRTNKIYCVSMALNAYPLCTV